ncbi:MAG: phosphatidate cytidylyltransferase [Acidobacteria bacterium]|nr:MAG: phosphatidate cytidylyltransferase [Acidobacteriota bacterium]
MPGTIRDYARRGGFMLSVFARILLVLLVAVTLAGCAAIAGIFKAGFWVGIVIAVIVVVALFALFGRRG